MSAQEFRPLLMLDETATVNTWPIVRAHLPFALDQFRPIPGRGFRIRVEVVDTTELEQLEKRED